MTSSNTSPLCSLFPLVICTSFFLLYSAEARPPCPRKTTYAIGSFNSSPWRDDFTGKGVTILSLRGKRLRVRRSISYDLIGTNPTYVARSLVNPNIFYVSNTAHPYGNITRFSLHPSTRALDPNSVRSIYMPGMRTTHVSVSSNNFVLSANVFGGMVYAFDAELRNRTGNFTVDPSLATGKVPRRQSRPNPHQVLSFDAADGTPRVAVPDLGVDRTFILNVTDEGKLTLVDTVRHMDGDGPRHAVHHAPSGNLFVVNELSRTVSVLCKVNAAGDKFEMCDRRQLLDDEGDVNGTAAAIRLSEDWRFLYVSVRPDSRDNPVDGRITAFSIDAATGMIKHKVGEWSSRGVHPRDFNIVENVRVKRKCRSYVIVANRESSNVVFIRRYRQSGRLGMAETRIDHIGSPSSVLQI